MTTMKQKKKLPAKKKAPAKRGPLKKKAGAKRVALRRKPIRPARFIESFIICEAIRNEERNKLTFLGVFSDTIALQTWPEDEDTKVALPLAFYLSFKFIEKSEVKVKLLSPSKSELFIFEQEVCRKAPESDLITIVLSPPGQALITELGVYSFVVEYCNKRDIREFSILVDPTIW